MLICNKCSHRLLGDNAHIYKSLHTLDIVLYNMVKKICMYKTLYPLVFLKLVLK